ncbi:MAG: MoxR family ATPase, partial [Gammaproteobacteria bacterium]
GPIFSNLVLADEINRAPAKVQSALLEAMAERQISVGNETRALPELFLVMATQNPIEQEGTYPLPEAQLDRFLLHVVVDYPDADAEHQILQLVRNEQREKSTGSAEPSRHISQSTLFEARSAMLKLHMEPVVEQYMVDLVVMSRQPSDIDDELASWISFGASPRGTIALDLAARGHAFLAGKDFVSPDDVQAVAHDVLRHRLILSFEAEAQGVSTNQAVSRLIERVATI